MKTMTCNQLGGACDVAFKAETFDEMAEQSKNHAMEMAAKNDQPHLDKMAEMKQLMTSPQAMNDWMEARKKEFEETPEDS